jgi:hypothetical protein
MLGPLRPDLRTAARQLSGRWTPPVILAGAVLSVLVSVLTVNVFGSYFGDAGVHPSSEAFWGHFAAFGFLILTSGVVAGSISGAFRRGDTGALLITVFVSYFSLMLLFASVYYETAFFGDYEDALFKYQSYRYDGLHNIAGPQYLSGRSFYGIVPRFWSGVDWPVRAGKFPNGMPPGAYRVAPAEMRAIAATHTAREVIQFIPEARLEIFADCLHLSVITMTTVGYGDITPRSLPARIAADVEAICNTLLLIFGVGVILGSRHLVPPAGPPPPPP